MPKIVNQAAQGAKEVKAELKKAFPTVKFNVSSKVYSGGSSIDIDWSFGPSIKEVKEISDRRQYGNFDGMTDSYNYTGAGLEVTENGLKEVASAKYVFENRNTKYLNSEYKLRADILNIYSQIGQMRGWILNYDGSDYTPDGGWAGADDSASNLYYRAIQEMSFVSDNVELIEWKFVDYEYNGKRYMNPYTIIYKDLNTGKVLDAKINL